MDTREKFIGITIVEIVKDIYAYRQEDSPEADEYVDELLDNLENIGRKLIDGEI